MHNSNNSSLKVFTSSTDKIGSKLFYEFIVKQARDFELSGSTVYRGIMGYGMSSTINSSKFWELTEKLPVVIEIVDVTEKLLDFYNHIKNDLESFSKGCMVTITPVTVLLNKAGESEKGR